MLHLGTADPVTRHHTDHQWSLEDELKLSETRPQACIRCSLTCMQSEQAEGGHVQSMSNQIGCGHQAQQGPRRRRCLSGKSHLCPSQLEPISARLTLTRDRTCILQNMREVSARVAAFTGRKRYGMLSYHWQKCFIHSFTDLRMF